MASVRRALRIAVGITALVLLPVGRCKCMKRRAISVRFRNWIGEGMNNKSMFVNIFRLHSAGYAGVQASVSVGKMRQYMIQVIALFVFSGLQNSSTVAANMQLEGDG